MPNEQTLPAAFPDSEAVPLVPGAGQGVGCQCRPIPNRVLMYQSVLGAHSFIALGHFFIIFSFSSPLLSHSLAILLHTHGSIILLFTTF